MLPFLLLAAVAGLVAGLRGAAPRRRPRTRRRDGARLEHDPSLLPVRDPGRFLADEPATPREHPWR